MSAGPHEYVSRLVWDGNRGKGTATYDGYGREYRVLIDGKPALEGSADAQFRGDAAKPNPEDLFVAAISTCHLLSYLALCARKGVSVVSYEDEARGRLVFTANGGGAFEEVVLRPRVTVAAGSDLALATRLHDEAHHLCYIASSCSVPIRHEPEMHIEGAS